MSSRMCKWAVTDGKHILKVSFRAVLSAEDLSPAPCFYQGCHLSAQPAATGSEPVVGATPGAPPRTSEDKFHYWLSQPPEG